MKDYEEIYLIGFIYSMIGIFYIPFLLYLLVTNALAGLFVLAILLFIFSSGFRLMKTALREGEVR
jgi:divalent metal cation (Fe/Co/Zn/Cd) transporter